MADSRITLNPSPIVQALGKPAEEFTRADLVRYVKENGVEAINFRYVAGDGRLKTLDFVINSEDHLLKILTMGERVDGSSLFPFVAATSSDLYVVPRYTTAFMDPFVDVPTLSFLCSFYDVNGDPLESAPENILRKAQASLKARTGCTLEALGELEYYILSPADEIYPIVPQRGYHESHPFSKWVALRDETMRIIVSMGGKIKYGHSEVGNFVSFGRQMVQQEIEFLPVPIEDAADQMAIAKWVLREVAYRNGLEVSYAPKIAVGQAGSGMHFHTRLMKDGVNQFADANGLTDTAKKVIAGYVQCIESLTAFGNTVPTSFLRLVPNQEAPTAICWGERNRSALVRVPLGWTGIGDKMIKHANPQDNGDLTYADDSQTVELRSPDGSANVPLLLAGIAVAARMGLEGEDSLAIAEATHVTKNASEVPDLHQLPTSCADAGRALLRQRERYEEDGVFPPGLIDAIAKRLINFEDEDLARELINDATGTEELVRKYLHIG